MTHQSFIKIKKIPGKNPGEDACAMASAKAAKVKAQSGRGPRRVLLERGGAFSWAKFPPSDFASPELPCLRPASRRYIAQYTNPSESVSRQLIAANYYYLVRPIQFELFSFCALPVF
ncbi:MAG: hypothetical protein CMF69_00920 [Magnetovibrio sp.]|nr:hypothetical protein [Magnetovibrio sp.]